MDVADAAARWAATWEGSWTAGTVEPIAALYAPAASYRSHPMRDPEPGGAHAFVSRTFAEEAGVRCQFGRPIAAGARAAVEWWASFAEDGAEVTLAGTTMLTFDADGLVVDHVDYWVQAAGRLEPFDGWGDGSGGSSRTP